MVRVLNEVGLGATCDDTNVCATGLMCTSAVCTAPAEVTTACAGATAIAVTPPTTTTTTGSATGSLAAGTGVLMGSCGPTEGSEALYTVTVPAGSFDLIARTDLDGTMDTDTIVYVRSTCADPLTEVACNDDVGGGVLGSRAEVTDASPGTYTIAVEPYGEGAADQPFELEVGLRPILAAGTACDPAGEMNRCAGMPCDASSMMCP
jgi:hypothetical protein